VIELRLGTCSVRTRGHEDWAGYRGRATREDPRVGVGSAPNRETSHQDERGESHGDSMDSATGNATYLRMNAQPDEPRGLDFH